MNPFKTRPKTRKEQIAKIRTRAIKINGELFALGMDEQEMTEFWEECFIHAEINHKLPPCTCGDVNQCELWCQTKAKFMVNPPD